MKRIMVDLETMSTRSNAAIIAIGAVKFSKNKGIYDSFYRNVDLQSCIDLGLAVDGDTVMWWLRQNDKARGQFELHESTLLSEALVAFAYWCNGGDKEIWGNGAAFDNVILANAYSALNKPLPWKFWEDRCYRTVKNLFPNIKQKRTGTHHNAVDDAETQAIHLLKIENNMGVRNDW